MSRYRPLIGITSGYDYKKGMLYVKNGYYEGICTAGGAVVAIPPVQDTEILDEIIDRCDGILLSGGPDLDAGFFGECNMQYNGEISPYRDISELYIAKKAVELDMPVLGICRGMQVINVALGGTLFQDIYSQIKDRELIRHSQDAPTWYPTHEVYIAEGSLMNRIFDLKQTRVNSFHHQAVKDLAHDFVVTSRADDYVVESIEHIKAKFVVGVQWHPELMFQAGTKFLNLFREFVMKAGKV